MTKVTVDARARLRVRSDPAAARPRSFVAAVFGNLALLSGIVTMPIVIAIGYLAQALR